MLSIYMIIIIMIRIRNKYALKWELKGLILVIYIGKKPCYRGVYASEKQTGRPRPLKVQAT